MQGARQEADGCSVNDIHVVALLSIQALQGAASDQSLCMIFVTGVASYECHKAPSST